MSAQTSYNYAMPKGSAGSIYDLSPYTINTRKVEADDGAIGFGMGVVIGTAAGTGIALPTEESTIAKFEGITVNGYTTEMDINGNTVVRKNASIGVMEHGKVWGRIKSGLTIAYGDAVHLILAGDDAGKFTNVSSATTPKTLQITGAKFIGTKGDGDVAPISLA